MNDPERVVLTREQADELMTPGDYVHTFMQAHGQPGLVLLGADWDRAGLLALAAAGKLELAGETASKMNHGICAFTENGHVFVATRELKPANE